MLRAANCGDRQSHTFSSAWVSMGGRVFQSHVAGSKAPRDWMAMLSTANTAPATSAARGAGPRSSIARTPRTASRKSHGTMPVV